MQLDPRDQIADTLASTNPRDEPCVLQGFVVIYEWAEMDGKRWLHVLTGSDRSSNHYITEWQISGYLHEALNGVWQRPEDTQE
jgi:hypothetical protein